jgi:uncharacterized coiled-coil protein SlyX
MVRKPRVPALRGTAAAARKETIWKEKKTVKIATNIDELFEAIESIGAGGTRVWRDELESRIAVIEKRVESWCEEQERRVKQWCEDHERRLSLPETGKVRAIQARLAKLEKETAHRNKAGEALSAWCADLEKRVVTLINRNDQVDRRLASYEFPEVRVNESVFVMKEQENENP